MLIEDIRAWVKAFRELPENPLAHWFHVIHRRRQMNRALLTKLAPILLGALPVVLILGIGIYDNWFGGYTDPMEFVKYSLAAFVLVAYVVWAARTLNVALMDTMAVLSRSAKLGNRYQLDDLAAVSSITNHEIVAGVVRVLLPQLWLRAGAGAVLAWLSFFTIITEFWTDMPEEAWLSLIFSPFVIGGIALSSFLGCTALVLYYLCLGGGISFIPGSLSGTANTIAQGLWLMFSVSMVMAFSMSGAFPSHIDNASRLSLLMALLTPVLFIGLVALSLRIASRWPLLKPVFAIGTPLLLPFLFIVLSATFLAFNSYIEDESWAFFYFGLASHFGDLLPLNPMAIPHAIFLGIDTDISLSAPGIEWFRFYLIIASQLLLIIICSRYALRAVAARRQSVK